MTSKPYDNALDFLPEVKVSKGGPSVVSLFKTVAEAFNEARSAEALYHALIARGHSHEEAARKVFDVTYKAA